MADIKKIKLPNGSEYEIKDETAREQMEVKSNKITALDSASTDSQYPSAKAVYDMIQTASAKIQYTFTDTDSNGNIVISAVLVGGLDSTGF